MKTIIFNNDEFQKFDIDLIERIKIKSIFKDEFLDCEHWGWNDEGENGLPFFDFGCFGEIMFEISKTGMRLYFPHTIGFSYSKDEPNKIYAYPYQKHKKEVTELSPFSLGTELEIKQPVKSMFDLKTHLQHFVNKCIQDFEQLKHEHFL